jgi:hypothetical protein
LVKEKTQIFDDYDELSKNSKEVAEKVLEGDADDLWVRDHAGNKVTLNYFNFACASSRILDQILKTKGKK